MQWNIPLHCDWFNKKADWPIAGQDKIRQESQTENDEVKEGPIQRSCQPDGGGVKGECAMLIKVPLQSRA